MNVDFNGGEVSTSSSASLRYVQSALDLTFIYCPVRHFEHSETQCREVEKSLQLSTLKTVLVSLK